MIRIRDTRYPSTAALLGDAVRIAEYYGFVPIEDLPRAQDLAKKPPPSAEVEEALSFARKDERGLTGMARKAALSARQVGEALFAWRVVQPQNTIPSVSLELHVFG